MARFVPLNAKVHAAKVRLILPFEHAHEAPFGAGLVARFEQNEPFLEQELAVLGKVLTPFPARRQRLLALSQLALALRDRRVQLAHDGITGFRALQAALQVGERFAGLPLVLDHQAQVEERERIVGLFAILQLQEPQVALRLAPA